MYVYDDSRHPLVIIHVSGSFTDAEIHRFMNDLRGLVDREAPHALIYDLAHAEIPRREVVMDMLRWTRELRVHHKALYEDRPDPIPTYTAYFMPGRLGSLLRFFEQMLPGIRNQQGYFEDLESAVVASEQALLRFGLDVPPAVLPRRRAGS